MTQDASRPDSKRSQLHELAEALREATLAVREEFVALLEKVPLAHFEQFKTVARPFYAPLDKLPDLRASDRPRVLNITTALHLNSLEGKIWAAPADNFDVGNVPWVYDGDVLQLPDAIDFTFLARLFYAELSIKRNRDPLYMLVANRDGFLDRQHGNLARSEDNSAQVTLGAAYLALKRNKTVATTWTLRKWYPTPQEHIANYKGDVEITHNGKELIVCCPWAPDFPDLAKVADFFRTLHARFAGQPYVLLSPSGWKKRESLFAKYRVAKADIAKFSFTRFEDFFAY